MTSTVIVLCYRPGPWLADCLASVVPQADQVLLVDNGSPNQEAATMAEGKGATVLRSPVNLGFAGGVNLGVRHATGEVIALLNDDAVAGPGWLASASEILEDRGVGAVSPKVLLTGTFGEIRLDDDPWYAPGDQRQLGRQLRSVTVAGTEMLEALVGPGVHRIEQVETAGRVDRWRWTTGRDPIFVPLTDGASSGEILVNSELTEAFAVTELVNNAGCYLRSDGYAGDYGLETPDDGRFDQPAERFGLSGTALVTRADVLAGVGGMAAEFFAYYEDIDWSWRARSAGLRLLYDPKATVYHQRSLTSGGTAKVRLLAERNRLLCLVRNAPPAVAGRFLWHRAVDGPGEGIRRGVARMLPWAVASRARLRGARKVGPREVWDRWAGVDVRWDRLER